MSELVLGIVIGSIFFTNVASLSCPLPQFHVCERFLLNTYIPHTPYFCSQFGYERCTHKPTETTESKNVNITELKKAIQYDGAYIIDVRTFQEASNGRVPARRWLNVPYTELETAIRLSEKDFVAKYGSPLPDKDENIIFHCRSGIRSRVALAKAIERGFTNVKHYPGGWLEWTKLN